MTHHDEGDEHQDQPNPQPTTDDATKADAGLTGTPAQAYSPEGMDEDDAPKEGGTYQPDDADGDQD